MDFILNQILFLFSIAFLLFMPGYFLLLALLGKNNNLNQLEKIVIHLGSSFAITSFLMLIIGKTGLSLNKYSIIASLLFFCAILFSIYKFRKNKGLLKNHEHIANVFSKKQSLIIILLLFLTILIKTIYLQNTIFPTSTDLGHHMYWSKLITTTGKIPVYQESDILITDSTYSIGEPEKIADFIIGEHLIFSAINILSGADFISAFPSLVLFIINIFAILSLFILSFEIFKDYKDGRNIALATLFLAGPLYALSSPQAKFVSGGVIGNTIGNFLIPLIFYFLIKAFREKSPANLFMALFSGLALSYTHHLSTFVFIFSIIFSFFSVLLIFKKRVLRESLIWIKTFISPLPIVIIIFGALMISYIYTPTYLNISAVDTAVGSPVKSTRTGLSFSQLASSSGEAKIILGILGLFALIFLTRARDYGRSILVGWSVAIFIMSLWPNILFIDIPSSRIANYISMPLSLLSSFFIFFIVNKISTSRKDSESSVFSIKPAFFIISIILLVTFSITNGFFDNSKSLSEEGNTEKAVQTFEASNYLSKFISDEDVVLKDHNYLVADSWIKLFFMKDYNFPLSRAYFKRYEDEAKKREQCTLLMISLPGSEDAQKCFSGTKTNFIMVNPENDGTQFKKNNNFWQVYQSNSVSIFHKNIN